MRFRKLEVSVERRLPVKRLINLDRDVSSVHWRYWWHVALYQVEEPIAEVRRRILATGHWLDPAAKEVG